MREILEDLASQSIPWDQVERGADLRLREEFEFRLREQLGRHGGFPSEVYRWAEELVEMSRDADVSVLRTEGLMLLSRIIMAVYSEVDASGNLTPLPLLSPSELTEEQLNGRYGTWCPSTMYAEVHPEIEILMVGQAPAYAENKIGVPLVDYWNLTRSDCMTCVHMERCFFGSVLVDGSRARFEHRLLGCDYSPCGDDQFFTRQEEVRDLRCYTAGELLRQLLVLARIRRPCWGDGVEYRGWVVAAATNAYRRTTFRRSATGISNGAPDDTLLPLDAGWLWLEAALVRPKVTVLLGNDALAAYQLCTGTKKKPGANPFDRHPPFGIVYKTFHPSYVMRGLHSPWKVAEVLNEASQLTLGRHSMIPSQKNHHIGVLFHMLGVLTSARKLVRQTASIVETIEGSDDILPSYLLGSDLDEAVQVDV